VNASVEMNTRAVPIALMLAADRRHCATVIAGGGVKGQRLCSPICCALLYAIRS